MTKYLIVPILLFLLSGCSQNNTGKSSKDSLNSNQKKDSVSNIPDKKITSDSLLTNDAALISLSNDILNLIKNKDFTHLSAFINPDSGMRFSPYGIVDTVKNQKLLPHQFINLLQSKKIIKWGFFEGTGEPIDLSLSNYFKRFVYDVDFINAEKKSVNKIIGSDSSLSNISTIYPGCNFVQFYFSGFNKKYEGMDWKSLVLVFREKNKKLYLVGVVHDEWKI